jgi:hypothetical protein
MEVMIQLRPPADADNYRVKAGRFGDRFYTDPLPADGTWEATSDDDIYPAISTVKKATGQDWSKAMAKRLAKAPSQLVEIGNLDSESERKARINLLSDEGLGQASGRGTIVHQHAEALLTGRLPIYQMTDVVKPYIARLEDFFAAYQPVLAAAEFVAINRDLNDHGVKRGNEFRGYGGTGDAVVEIGGKLYLVDWKSRAEDSDHKAYAEEAAQVAAYGRADYWIVGCDESINGAKRIAPLDLAGGLIVSIKPDSYECFPIDLDEGFAYWTDLHAWWQARRSERRPIGRKWAPRVPVTSELAAEETAPPTRASNRERFDALPEVKKGWAREAFKRKGINPAKAGYEGDVARILADIEQRPSLREAQEARAEFVATVAAMSDQETCPSCGAVAGTCGPPDSDHCDDTWHGPLPKRDPLEAEGGPASDELVAEARLLFDMVIGPHGRKWTGFRVTEANEAEVPFLMSQLSSMKRAHIYLALTTWAAFRGEALLTDEAEGNIELASILFMIDGIPADHHPMKLGHRLGVLSAAEAERFAAEVAAVVQSETGEQPLPELQTTNN